MRDKKADFDPHFNLLPQALAFRETLSVFVYLSRLICCAS